jgi:uncharacterized protein YxjI
LEELPLAGRSKFIIRQKALAIGDTYTVMDENKADLFIIKQAGKEAVKAALVGAALGAIAGDAIGGIGKRRMERNFDIMTLDGRWVGRIYKGKGAYKSPFDVTLSNGQLVAKIATKRSFIGGLKASLLDGNGQPMISTKGNLIRRKYMMKDNGGNEIARVTAKLLQIRDTYTVELKGNMHPIYPLAFAIIIDFEKDA